MRSEMASRNSDREWGILAAFYSDLPPKSPILEDFEQLESDEFSDRASSITPPAFQRVF